MFFSSEGLKEKILIGAPLSPQATARSDQQKKISPIIEAAIICLAEAVKLPNNTSPNCSHLSRKMPAAKTLPDHYKQKMLVFYTHTPSPMKDASLLLPN